MWPLTPIEEITKYMLEKELERQPQTADTRWGYYTTACNRLIINVLDEIRASLPQHTDHGQRHVIDVLQRAGFLIGLNGCVAISGSRMRSNELLANEL